MHNIIYLFTVRYIKTATFPDICTVIYLYYFYFLQHPPRPPIKSSIVDLCEAKHVLNFGLRRA